MVQQPRTPKKKHCMRCRQRTDHVFDHGRGMYSCQNCDF